MGNNLRLNQIERVELVTRDDVICQDRSMLGMGLMGLKYLVTVIGFYFLCIGARHAP